MKNRKRKPEPFEYLEAIVYDPAPGTTTPSGEAIRGKLFLWLGEIPNAPGHCAVVSEKDKVEWMHHTVSFRKARDDEW